MTKGECIIKEQVDIWPKDQRRHSTSCIHVVVDPMAAGSKADHVTERQSAALAIGNDRSASDPASQGNGTRTMAVDRQLNSSDGTQTACSEASLLGFDSVFSGTK